MACAESPPDVPDHYFCSRCEHLLGKHYSRPLTCPRCGRNAVRKSLKGRTVLILASLILALPFLIRLLH